MLLFNSTVPAGLMLLSIESRRRHDCSFADRLQSQYLGFRRHLHKLSSACRV